MTLHRTLPILLTLAVAASACPSTQTAESTAPAAPAEAAEEAEAVSPERSDEAAAAADSSGEAPEGTLPAVGSETPEQILGAIAGEGPLHATFVTSFGEIRCRLFEDEVPITVANFVGLATGTKTYLDPATNEPRRSNFYDGLIFHRVIPNFMIQGGDPLGRGTGGPGYRFEDEFHPRLRHDRPGILAMANSGPATNGSQFYITEVPTPHLDNRHSVFGACENVDIVTRIANTPTGPGSRPLQDVTIDRLVISRGE